MEQTDEAMYKDAVGGRRGSYVRASHAGEVL